MSERLRFAALDVESLARVKPDGTARVRLGGAEYEVSGIMREGDALSFVLDGQRRRFAVCVEPQRASVDDGRGISTAQRIEPGAAAGAGPDADALTSKMPGKVLQLLVAPGSSVAAGTPLLILEAMKMEHQVVAPADGTLRAYPVVEGQRVMPGDLLADFEAAG
jgi:3-methylcrotonyl-CoA carboxylase alpha subunit